jgi:hypothetical protein
MRKFQSLLFGAQYVLLTQTTDILHRVSYQTWTTTGPHLYSESSRSRPTPIPSTTQSHLRPYPHATRGSEPPPDPPRAAAGSQPDSQGNPCAASPASSAVTASLHQPPIMHHLQRRVLLHHQSPSPCDRCIQATTPDQAPPPSPATGRPPLSRAFSRPSVPFLDGVTTGQCTCRAS